MANRSETSPAPDGAGLQPPRSDAVDNNSPAAAAADSTGVSPAANASQKRGRGRPPKSKSDSDAVSAQPTRKPSGRPKRNAAAGVAAAVARSGRGRPRRLTTLPATESSGSRKRGRPKKDDVAAAPAKKRGRKPKSEEVPKKTTVGRTRKATEAATGQGTADPRELKKKAVLLQKKVKQAAEKLQIAVSAVKEVQKIADGM